MPTDSRSVTVPAHLLERVLRNMTHDGWCDVCDFLSRDHAPDCPVPELQQALQTATPAPRQEAEFPGRLKYLLSCLHEEAKRGLKDTVNPHASLRRIKTLSDPEMGDYKRPTPGDVFARLREMVSEEDAAAMLANITPRPSPVPAAPAAERAPQPDMSKNPEKANMNDSTCREGEHAESFMSKVRELVDAFEREVLSLERQKVADNDTEGDYAGVDIAREDLLALLTPPPAPATPLQPTREAEERLRELAAAWEHRSRYEAVNIEESCAFLACARDLRSHLAHLALLSAPTPTPAPAQAEAREAARIREEMETLSTDKGEHHLWSMLDLLASDLEGVAHHQGRLEKDRERVAAARAALAQALAGEGEGT